MIISAFELLQIFLILVIRWVVQRRTKVLWLAYALILILGNSLLIIAVNRISSWGFMIFVMYLTLLWMFFLSSVVLIFAHKVTGSRYPVFFKCLIPLGYFALLAYAWHNAHSPAIREYRVEVDKPLAQPLKILVAADLHLDYLVGNRAIQQLVEVNKQVKPDLILLPGDIINDDAAVFYKYQMEKDLQQLHAPLGVYASLGNHEFYGLLKQNIEAIELSNIKLLRDQAVVINNSFILVGREDQTNPYRKPLRQILQGFKTQNLPVIVMDHRPYLDEATRNKVDIQVSGHTHNGQMFPMNYVVSSIYELAYGYKQKESSHFFTTSGWGFWGSPFRLGSQREVFVLEVVGK
ncbi:metallophosphoesterase [Psittacicella melopsittaci]|nr:metallophosphoesterase [Psittacicella melopsittaci]